MATELEIEEVDFAKWREQIRSVRFTVFVDEQKVPAEIEMDAWDDKSRHVLALAEGLPVGTGRLLPDGHIGRLAVLKEWRGKKVGLALMQRLMQMGQDANMPELILSAQTHAAEFYRRLGFVAMGKPYQEAGIEHIEMRRKA
ncbi:GNAT family N-acetyltransferase [Pelagicoccus albus]|uniref:GNAT family N-acetyltransferase n=1 Tax=Pelagicoccus albus TaxID=415222 RepID=A0A7X1BB63_9BACT|nr:GNAT family N-acetyltransferase [Pelagicoccus albus]MBC2607755.1 GNAT family N-acetyltransferase [Pelagicoccus albus]